MLFKRCKFKEKPQVRKQYKESILTVVKSETRYSDCNEGMILQYIDLLLDETEYNPKQGVFYYRSKSIKVTLDDAFLAKVAVEYINEHINDFLLENLQSLR